MIWFFKGLTILLVFCGLFLLATNLKATEEGDKKARKRWFISMAMFWTACIMSLLLVRFDSSLSTWEAILVLASVILFVIFLCCHIWDMHRNLHKKDEENRQLQE